MNHTFARLPDGQRDLNDIMSEDIFYLTAIIGLVILLITEDKPNNR